MRFVALRDQPEGDCLCEVRLTSPHSRPLSQDTGISFKATKVMAGKKAMTSRPAIRTRT